MINAKNKIDKNLKDEWHIVSLADVCEDLQSGKRPKGGVQGISSGIPSIGAEHLSKDGGFNFTKIKFVPSSFAKGMNKGKIKLNDIIVVKDGATTAKTSFVGPDFPYKDAVINEHVFIVRVTNEVLPKFAFYKLWSSSGSKEILLDFRGAAQGGISSGFIDKVSIPLPSIQTQQSIIYKIEEVFSELDKGIENLRFAQQQLKVYRQSVLKWAFEGRLTNKNVKEGELPKGWTSTRLGNIANAIDPQPSHRTPPIFTNGVPFVSIKDFDSILDKIDFTYARRVSPKILNEHLERYSIMQGDFVIGKIGTIGKPVRVVLPQDYCLSANIVLIQPRKINSTYLYYFFQSSLIEKAFTEGTKATSQPAFGIQKVRELQIKIPKDNEQFDIVQAIERRLSVADKTEESINQSLQQAEVMRQSVLKRAFEGRLFD